MYASLLLLLVLGFGYAVTHRMPLDVDVLRDRNALYRELNDGRIENVYSMRIINKDQHGHEFPPVHPGLPNAVVDSDSPTTLVGAEDVKTIVARVRVPTGPGARRAQVSRSSPPRMMRHGSRSPAARDSLPNPE